MTMSKLAGLDPQVRRFLPIGVGIVVVVIVVGAVLLTRSTGFAATNTGIPTFAVQQGPLTISVSEAGAIKSQEQIVLKNEVEGQTTLLFLIPEGTRVAAEQLLAELDASKLQDDRVEQEIRVENANAEHIRSRENLAVVKNQSDSDISKAQLAYDFALEDKEKYEKGEYPQQLREAESKITIAGEEQERATEKLEWSKRLQDEKYLSHTEYEADRLAYERAKLDYELAVAARELLTTYTHNRQVAQLDSDVDQSKMALERTKLKAHADVVQAEADLKAKEAELQQQRNKLAKNQAQIDKTKITAPREGLVVYATSTRTGGRGGMTQPLEEGQTVRERQELIYLPSTEAMMAELMIHESSLEKVKVGQPVEVSVDAMPGKLFTGEVKFIAPLPDAQNMFMNPDRKVYTTRVYLDGSNPELRTGMSCRAEIIVQKLTDATFIPIQSLVRVNGQPTVYVRSGDQYKPRVVTAGLDNSTMVHIMSGVTQGELVSLLPPLDTGTVRFAAATPTTAPAASARPERSVPSSQPAADRPIARDATSQPGAERGPRPPGGDVSDEERAARRERFQNMTPEERAAERRKRMESMTPEERKQFEERMRQRQGGGEQGGGPGAGRASEGGADGARSPAGPPPENPEKRP
jgi:HlyD family secretion protein